MKNLQNTYGVSYKRTVWVMIKYVVVWEGDSQAEFDTLQEAREYIKADIKGTAEHLGKSQKWVKEKFTWTIETVKYEEEIVWQA